MGPQQLCVNDRKLSLFLKMDATMLAGLNQSMVLEFESRRRAVGMTVLNQILLNILQCILVVCSTPKCVLILTEVLSNKLRNFFRGF